MTTSTDRAAFLPFESDPPPTRATSALRPRRRPAGSAAAEALYCLLDLPLSILFFTVTITLVTVGLGTAIIYVGLLVLVLGLLFARGTGAARRALSASLLDHQVEAPAPIRPRRPGLWGGLSGVLVDGPSWNAVLYHCISIVLGPFRFAVALTLYVAGLGGLAYPLWYRWLPLEQAADGRWHRGAQWGPDFFVDTPPAIAVLMLLSAGVLFLAPRIVHALTEVERGLISGLLGRRS